MLTDIMFVERARALYLCLLVFKWRKTKERGARALETPLPMSSKVCNRLALYSQAPHHWLRSL